MKTWSAGEQVNAADLNGNFNELNVKFRYGGTGADGALSISSGTTTLDLAGVRVFVKNYTSISITGTGALAFSNPHTNGTIIVLKSQGDVVLTSSANPTIDLRNLGGAGVTSHAQSTPGSPGRGFFVGPTNGTGGSLVGGAGTGGRGTHTNGSIDGKAIPVFTGAGGGTSWHASGGDPGVSGRGGGGLYIECAGDLNFTSVINAAGGAASGKSGPGSNNSTAGGGGGGSVTDGSSGGTVSSTTIYGSGGGGGGSIVILANTISVNSGTLTVGGGSAEAGGGNGADGFSLVALNTEFA